MKNESDEDLKAAWQIIRWCAGFLVVVILAYVACGGKI